MHIFWTILGIIFLYLDKLKARTYKLALCASCLFCGILAYKFPKEPEFQIYGFFGFFVVFFALMKLSLNKEKKDNQKNVQLKEYIGKQAKVIKDIGKTLSIDGLGMIEFENQNWSAKSIDDNEIKAGASVIIVSKENKIMNVKVEN